jgi:hypothetical protein
MMSISIVGFPFFELKPQASRRRYAFLGTAKSTMPPISATAPAMGGRATLCVLSRVAWNRPDVDNLFPGCVRKTSPRKTEQAKGNQNYSKRSVHGVLLLRLLSGAPAPFRHI